ncbi:MAG: EAL domain-containing protein [Candidatus Andeanibacterium colombiense]|uniref:EAL domain-containing protein n=1 Tax=Candidatus Andeanibacterium colombiense TaxID=3121345 RepID=A0AAJ5X9W9_9SPHN|nr:MAG: EAL domain-containing protein [Sphingomonadaceae bacterium]
MAPVLAASFLFAALIDWRMPPVAASVTAGIAVVFSLLSQPVRLWERRRARRLPVRIATMLLVIGLPMFAYGYAIASWGVEHGLAWQASLGTLIVVTSLAAVIQSGRAPGLFAAQIACWSAVALTEGSVGSLGLLVAGVLFAVLVSRKQMHLVRIAREKEFQRNRIRDRAEDILNDYEDTGQGWFWETDRRGALTYVSHTVAQVLGFAKPEALLGKAFTDLFDLEAGGQEGERTLTFHLSARSSFQELAVRAAAREERWWSVSGRPVYDGFGNFVGYRGSGTDLTEKKRSQEKASRLAHYDSLTGLANRFQMSQSLEKILTVPIELHRCCAVLLLDLDRFKQVNDTMGHPAGDALLMQVAQRLERTVEEHGLVGRLGGDEFEVILPGTVGRERLAELAQEVINSLSQPYSIESHRVVIGASIGISIAPDDGVTSEALIRNADLALYAAKDAGRGRYHFYADDLHSQAEERRQLEQDLRDAISHGGLELYYQPVVDTATERISGFEALMRWRHPAKGQMSPAKFIAIAEDAGLIGPMGEWALRTACHDAAKWPENVRIAVNVSPLQFANPQLPSIVTSAVAEAGIDPGRLELEITESVFLNDDEGTDAMFAALKRVGVRLALDDFGTGYSSLGYLKKAPFDKIKIDQSFVRGATQPGSRNGAIIASITSLAQALGMETTAEGVETLDELDLIRMQGCSHVQGFIYEQPLSASAAANRLKTGLAAVARGPRSARSPRQTMLRKVVLDHDGQLYNGTIRNISATGVLIEGLWNVPTGTIFRIKLSQSHTITGTSRWCEEDRMGIEFATPLQRDATGRIAAIADVSPEPIRKMITRKAG